MGKLRLGTKSDFVGCLEKLVPSTTKANSLPDVQPCHVPTVDTVIDGAAIVSMLKPGTAGILLEDSTRLRLPLPTILRVYAFKLPCAYSSHTKSTLCKLHSCAVIYGKKTWEA